MTSWLRACTLAEAVGITAAAGAARVATWVTETRHASPGWALVVVVAGGLVEGAALGVLQARALRGRVGASAARRWALATVLVAGLSWAGASAPATLSGDSAGTSPPLWLVLGGAAMLGALTGAVLGDTQATAVRVASPARARWVRSSTLGWAAAMPVIFLGASLPDASWPSLPVVALGTATGTVAGAVLGLLTRDGAARLTPLPVRGPKVPPARAIRPWGRTPAGS